MRANTRNARNEAYPSCAHERSDPSRAAPGCLDVAITADPVDPRRINNFERWDSWESIEAWRARANAPETGIAIHEVDVTAYEVASTRPPF